MKKLIFIKSINVIYFKKYITKLRLDWKFCGKMQNQIDRLCELYKEMFNISKNKGITKRMFQIQYMQMYYMCTFLQFLIQLFNCLIILYLKCNLNSTFSYYKGYIYYNLKNGKKETYWYTLYNKNICTYTVLSYFFLFLNSMPILKYIQRVILHQVK